MKTSASSPSRKSLPMNSILGTILYQVVPTGDHLACSLPCPFVQCASSSISCPATILHSRMSSLTVAISLGSFAPYSGITSSPAAAAFAALSSFFSFKYSACDCVNAVNLDSSSGGSSLPFGSHTSSFVYTCWFISGPLEPSSVFSR